MTLNELEHRKYGVLFFCNFRPWCTFQEWIALKWLETDQVNLQTGLQELLRLSHVSWALLKLLVVNLLRYILKKFYFSLAEKNEWLIDCTGCAPAIGQISRGQ